MPEVWTVALKCWVIVLAATGVQAQAPGNPGTGAVPIFISDAEVCSRSMPGEQGYPLYRSSSSIGISSSKSVLQYLGGSLGPGVGSNNPCVVQCQGATGNTWSAAKPWGSPCILNNEQRFCASNVCVLKNDSYLDYCRQNFQTSNQILALIPYACSLECMDAVTGIVLKVRMNDGTPCYANTGYRYQGGYCYSGSCSILTFPYVRQGGLSHLNIFGSAFG
ncbi:unnamed protein product [Ixodes pacificus]